MKKWPQDFRADAWIMEAKDTIRVPIPGAAEHLDCLELTIDEDGALSVRSLDGGLVIKPQVSNIVTIYRVAFAESIYDDT